MTDNEKQATARLLAVLEESRRVIIDVRALLTGHTPPRPGTGFLASLAEQDMGDAVAAAIGLLERAGGEPVLHLLSDEQMRAYLAAINALDHLYREVNTQGRAA